MGWDILRTNYAEVATRYYLIHLRRGSFNSHMPRTLSQWKWFRAEKGGFLIIHSIFMFFNVRRRSRESRLNIIESNRRAEVKAKL